MGLSATKDISYLNYEDIAREGIDPGSDIKTIYTITIALSSNQMI